MAVIQDLGMTQEQVIITRLNLIFEVKGLF